MDRSRPRVAPLLLFGLSSCTLFGGLDGFSGGRDPSADDGESGSDAAIEDGGTSADAPTDEAALPAQGAFSCAALSPPPTFCADFDTGGPVNQGWDAIVGGIALDSAFATSAPSSARARATTAGASSYLKKDFAVSPSRARLEADVRLDKLTPDAVNVIRLTVGSSILFLRLTPSGAYLAHDSPTGYSQYSLSSYPGAETWIRMALTVEVLSATDAGVSASASLAFDGSIVGQRDIVLASARGVTVHVGLAGGKTTGADADIRYDNVIVQLE